MPKALEFAWFNDKRIVDFVSSRFHLLFSEMTAWLSAGIGFEFKRGRDTPSDAIDMVLFTYLDFGLKFVLLSFVSQ